MADTQDLTQNAEKDPHDWTTGDEPATGPQLSYLHTLAQQAGEDIKTDGISKAQASLDIERLQNATGRTGTSESTETKTNA